MYDGHGLGSAGVSPRPRAVQVVSAPVLVVVLLLGRRALSETQAGF